MSSTEVDVIWEEGGVAWKSSGSECNAGAKSSSSFGNFFLVSEYVCEGAGDVGGGVSGAATF